MYIVYGITKGLSETVLADNKKRVKRVSLLRKLGEIKIKALDKKPKIRVAVNGENEMQNYLEWKDMVLHKWHSNFTIDPALYDKTPLEILRKK